MLFSQFLNIDFYVLESLMETRNQIFVDVGFICFSASRKLASLLGSTRAMRTIHIWMKKKKKPIIKWSKA